ncbi:MULTISPECIES: TetR/AcrR family transcriptional regulator [unclassified Clostridium]|uniref:TetR/AcrR family transcriptional regulator n=1 Tax=unclassified Clostridium TaxID=2614128 RepID=UPI00029791DD|nr:MULTISPECIES: TetR/AcrR family transcriptional regulator [unclassified Clostridium]EKQ55464.1 MAG: transcriptional regulator [Clostridium sp. Maddingley MBC34-26]
MRYKDDDKKESIIKAAIQLINKVGLAEISMSKIAKEAGVAAGTIYTYFDNKDDMLKKLFLEAKKDMQEKVSYGVNISCPVEAEFKILLSNYINFFINNKDNFLFMEQFTNSPYILELHKEFDITGRPLLEFMENGKKQGVFKEVDSDLLFIYSFSPLIQIAKKYFNGEFEFTQQNVEEIIGMSWASIKK